jgi:hypothetical protein
LQRSIHRAEDMGAGGGRLGDANRKRDLAVLVSAGAEAGGYIEIGRVKILGEILVEVAAFERVGVAARSRVWSGLR